MSFVSKLSNTFYWLFINYVIMISTIKNQ